MSEKEENELLKETLDKIEEILRESNVLPAPNCKLFLKDGVKICKLIEECKEKLGK